MRSVLLKTQTLWGCGAQTYRVNLSQVVSRFVRLSHDDDLINVCSEHGTRPRANSSAVLCVLCSCKRIRWTLWSLWCLVNALLCVQCHSVMSVNSDDRCAFVKKTPDCKMTEGFINYLQEAFCLLPPRLTPLTISLCVRSVAISSMA